MNRKKIIPAVFGQTYSEIERQLKILEGHTEWAHLDVTDGRFTSFASWPEDPSDSSTFEVLRFLGGQTKIEVHLMVEEPELIISDWSEVVDRIIVHQEATEGLKEIIGALAPSVIRVGVALLLPTSIEMLKPYFSKIDLVQLMSIAEIGAQGQPFNERVLEKVKHLRALAPNVTIQIDGGVNLEIMQLALMAGVDNLVVGSAIWKTPEPIVSLKNFQSLLPES